jgi:hypothetical protein
MKPQSGFKSTGVLCNHCAAAKCCTAHVHPAQCMDINVVEEAVERSMAAAGSRLVCQHCHTCHVCVACVAVQLQCCDPPD